MNRLVWKELMELRFIPLAYAALLAAVLLVGDVLSNYVASHGGQSTDRMTAGAVAGLLGSALLIVGLFPGCNAVANETSHGTLSFLSAIPIGPAKIWLSKVSAGIITMLASAIAMALTCSTVLWLAFHSALLPAIQTAVFGGIPVHSTGAMAVALGLRIVVFAALCTYSISLFSSTLTDRPLAATGVAVVIGVVLLAGFGAFANHLQRAVVLPLGVVLVTPGFFLASWLSFKEIRQSSSLRMRVVGIGCAAIWLGLMWMGGTFYFYEEDLASSYVPEPTFLGLTQLGTRDSKGYITGLNDDFIFRARPGHQYTGFVDVVSTGLTQPFSLTIVSDSSDLTGSIHKVNLNGPYILHKTGKSVHYDSTYALTFVYKPTLPVGQETSTILVKLPKGKTVATVRIIANKTEQYVPDISSFPDARM